MEAASLIHAVITLSDRILCVQPLQMVSVFCHSSTVLDMLDTLTAFAAVENRQACGTDQ